MINGEEYSNPLKFMVGELVLLIAVFVQLGWISRRDGATLKNDYIEKTKTQEKNVITRFILIKKHLFIYWVN